MNSDSTTEYTIWVCGRINHSYGAALRGVTHVEIVGTGKTLCGLPAYERETRNTLWWKDNYGRTEYEAEGASCNRCRSIAGLEKQSQPVIAL